MTQIPPPAAAATATPAAATMPVHSAQQGFVDHNEDVVDSAPVELMSFTMDGQYYAVDIMLVREIRGWSKPAPLPHSPKYMRGVINLRGTVLPILDLSARLNGTETEAGARNVIIVIEIADQVAGLLVDAVSDILTLKRDEMQAPPDIPGEHGDNFIETLTIVDGDMVRTLDMKALLQSATENAA